MKWIKAHRGTGSIIILSSMAGLGAAILFVAGWTLNLAGKVSDTQVANAATQQQVTDQEKMLETLSAKVDTVNQNLNTLLIYQGLPVKKAVP